MIGIILKNALVLLTLHAGAGLFSASAQEQSNKGFERKNLHGIGHIMASVHNQARPAKDKARDTARKPTKILRFAGIKPGMTVLDVNSGGGYYSEILSHAVGRDGIVYAHNGALYWNYVKDNTQKRYKNRLENVTQLHDGPEEIDLPEDSVDLAISVLAHHDYYFMPEGREAIADVPAVLESIYKALKPGAAFVIIDHVALAGSGTEAGNSLHRIDPALVKEQLLTAGFRFVGESDVLANPDDDHVTSPFDPSIRGKTDRFIYKFVK